MSHRTIALVVAGGRGSRARIGQPKQYAVLGGQPLLRRTLRAFLDHPGIDAVQVVIGEEDEDLYGAAVAGLEGLLPPTTGGDSRQASVFRGLRALQTHEPERVLIHDGARPFVSPETISAVLEALDVAEGAIAALPVSDTLKRAHGADGIAETVSRDGLWRAQTPQGFRFETILKAHQSADADSATDDASLLEADGVHVALVVDSATNIKLTYKEDFALAERMLAGAAEYRTGLGYDVHEFEPGDAVILCGVRIPHDRKLKGHSDADAGLHAITDAVLGAIGEGDIGTHFPPSDPQWKGAPSDVFLKHALSLLTDKGGSLVNLDLTLICEAPRIGPHRPAMVERLAEITGLAPDRLSIKATTTEGLGFTGRREGLAAQAVVSVRLPVAG